MADSVLSKLVGTDKETKKTLESIDTTLGKIYKQQKEQFKKDKTDKNRASRQAKRKQADKTTLVEKMGGKAKVKKESKGLLQTILGGGGFLGGIAKALVGSTVLTAAGVAVVGGIVTAYVASPKFRKAVNDATVTAFTFIKKNILDPSIRYLSKKLMEVLPDWVKTLIGVGPRGKKTPLSGALANTGADTDTNQGNINYEELIRERNKYMDFVAQTGVSGEGVQKRKAQFGKAVQFAQEKRTMQKKIEKATKELAEERKRLAKAEAAVQEIVADSHRVKISALEQIISENQTNLKIKTGQLTEAVEALQLSGDVFTKKQTGGAIVPGSGSGDKVPMLLPSGSFVLNRNAAGFQTGGIIPTMLEPGERVYGPGEWGPMHQMMNSMMPRFQTGGIVQANHAETGPGWSPGTDAQGRPAVFNKGGAEAWVQMMKDSNGQVKTTDINSSQRTAEKNASVGGAANSTHMVGNGVDVQTGSSSWNWMKANSSKYGWKWNDYMGPSGWHWDYTGQGGGNLSNAGNPGSEVQIEKETKTGFAGAMQSLQKMLQGAGKLGGFVSKVFGAMTTGFGAGLAKSGLGIDVTGITNFLGGGLTGFGNFLTGISTDEPMVGSTQISGSQAANTSLTANQKAILNALADAEGTSRYPNNGYNTQFTGTQFSGNKHPREIKSSNGYSSDAAGRYQFLSTTWDSYANGRDMSPSNQDAVALDLISKKRGVNISDGLSKTEIYKLGAEWASVEGGPNGVKGGSYGGQAKYSAEQFMEMYTKYGGTVQKQRGGIVNMRGGNNQTNSRFKEAQREFAQQIGEASAPIVVPIPMGGGGGGPQVTNTGNTTAKPPQLPDGPSSIQSAEYFYRLNMGSAF